VIVQGTAVATDAKFRFDNSRARTLTRNYRIAVLLPCYNEEFTVASTVHAFQEALPGADIYVYDNNSSDRTGEIARELGAIVRNERRQGKGNVVKRMFADVEADIYVMADGDNTYDAPSALQLIEHLIAESLDMVVGSRASDDSAAYRQGHRLGNRMLTGFVSWIFGDDFGDMLSGYRVFSRRFVKSFPALSRGFEIETELTVHALHLAMPVAECETPYYRRQEGSSSKLSTYRDGFRILRTIIILFKEEKPLLFFGIASLVFFLAAGVLAVPIFVEYYATGLVPRFPTAILVTSITLLGFLSLACGHILDTVSRGRREVKRLQYLQVGAAERRQQPLG
jgi:glycosyltransferase involved in cell wall biosynthesis